MPQFLIPVINYLAVAGAVSVGTAVAIGTFIASYGGAILLLGGLAMSASKSSKAKRQARDAFNAAQVDRMANIMTTTSPRELVMGRVRKGGTVFFRGSSGQNKSTFMMAIVIAAHEIDAVEAIYLNDVQVTLYAAGNVLTAPYAIQSVVSGSVVANSAGVATLFDLPIAGSVTAFTDGAQHPVSVSVYTVTTTPFATVNFQHYGASGSKANIRWHLGSDGQLADPGLLQQFPGLWTSAHRARGVAYLVCTFQFDETAFPTGLPSVTAVVRGARLYDPRLGVAVWSENPALMMRHVYTHPQFGHCTPTAEEDARIVAAANACDTSHGYVVGGVTETRALYRAAIVAPFGGPPKDLLDDLAQAMAGSWAFAAGQMYVKPGVWAPSVMSLTEADLAVVVRTGAQEDQQPISISVHRERVQKFNVVTATIWDAQQDYKQVTLTPVKASALIARDGSEIVSAVTLPGVNYAAQAQHVAGVMMRDARDPLTITLPFKLRAYPLELFDTVDLTIARYGWVGKKFQILGREWGSDGSLMITLKETAQAIYTPDAAFLAQGYAVNTALPNAWYVPQIGDLTVTSGTDDLVVQSDGSVLTRMRVMWPPVMDASVTEGGTIEVQYRDVFSTGAWSRAEVSGSETQVLIPGVEDDAYYTVRARARNRLAVGQWGIQVTHKVIGKTEPPPAFDRFLVLSQPDGTRQYQFGYTTTPSPVDWMGAQIRYLTGTHIAPDWDSMTVLSELETYYTASPVEANSPSAGPYTFACKSVDRSGNLSPYKLQTITLPDRRLGAVYAEYDEFADGWIGILTDCAVNPDGQLEAIDSTTWATTPATWDAWTAWNFAPATPIMYETPVYDLDAVISGQITSTVDALGAVTVELATSDDAATWSAWGPISGRFVSRYIKLRITVAATGPQPIPLVKAWNWLVDTPIIKEYVNDVDISALTGVYRIGTGDVRAPIVNVYTLIRRSSVVIQDSAGGEWTSVRIDQSNSPSPRWQFRLAGVLADPEFVDFIVEGFI